MQKQVIGQEEKLREEEKLTEVAWLDLDREARVEITSEDPSRPIESALRIGIGPGWRAADPGPQLVRLIFNQPQRVSRLWLKFTETEIERTQEFVLRWGRDPGGPLTEIVRQQWNFSPQGSSSESEDYRVDLDGAAVLELAVNPDVSGRKAFASLDELRVAS